jgi:hypothetical protein
MEMHDNFIAMIITTMIHPINDIGGIELLFVSLSLIPFASSGSGVAPPRHCCDIPFP